MFEAKLKRDEVIDRIGSGDRPKPRVSTTLPNGQQLIIPTVEKSRQHDAPKDSSGTRPEPS
ncbi:hypothetical protein [Tsukamurella strandjordii]|uniref:Uncharacterized protein n=1 Tax=Tsukamurella strandjordii TaxID=147577 RepID=A0AA90NBQ7_9ACTN|nr:hypothetical protein [Tsukamurella strandjordii]MDP0399557.1 hypothetical protein [Tsukamurella strandjordii]